MKTSIHLLIASFHLCAPLLRVFHCENILICNLHGFNAWKSSALLLRCLWLTKITIKQMKMWLSNDYKLYARWVALNFSISRSFEGFTFSMQWLTILLSIKHNNWHNFHAVGDAEDIKTYARRCEGCLAGGKSQEMNDSRITSWWYSDNRNKTFSQFLIAFTASKTRDMYWKELFCCCHNSVIFSFREKSFRLKSSRSFGFPGVDVSDVI